MWKIQLCIHAYLRVRFALSTLRTHSLLHSYARNVSELACTLSSLKYMELANKTVLSFTSFPVGISHILRQREVMIEENTKS